MGVSITGLGVMSAIGLSVAENLASLKTNKSGIRPCSLFAGFENYLVGQVGLSNKELKERYAISDRFISRTSLLGIAAAKEAWGHCEKNVQLKTGLISATSVGGMDLTEGFYQSYLKDENPDFDILSRHDSGNTSELIAKSLGISGYVNTLSTACSSGANAIMLGARLIEQGKLDRVLVGGSDPLTRFTINGFKSLMIYDEHWCRPFDASRNGLNLGEGAAFLLLENEKSRLVTENKVLCQLSGWANAADAYHQTASSPDGKGATLAIRNALKKSGIKPSDISYINAHGTGTKNNDLSESTALTNVFGSQIPSFSSTKPFTGHTLAAAGAIEAVFSVLAIQNGLIYPNLNFCTSIEETGLVPVIQLKANQTVTTCLSNSFGFGGNNSTLVFAANEF